jgi:stringent starvation protein B
MAEQAPSSTKPYLVRAIHEWCSDNGLTPYLAVAVTDQVRVPKAHVRNGEIVLNIGLLATDKLQMTNEDISFQARFSGRLHQIFVPIDSVMAIYAKETGNGMAFEVAIDANSEEAADPSSALGGEVVSITTRAEEGESRDQAPPSLGSVSGSGVSDSLGASTSSGTAGSSESAESAESSGTSRPAGPSRPSRPSGSRPTGRPTLTRVK